MYSLKHLARLHWELTMIKKIQQIDSIGIYTYTISKDLKGKN